MLCNNKTNMPVYDKDYLRYTEACRTTVNDKRLCTSNNLYCRYVSIFVTMKYASFKSDVRIK